MANVWTLNGDDWAVVKPVTSGILSRAELLLMNDDFSLSSPMWPDRSGNSHHGQLGSAGGSDTNDPVTLKKGTDGKFVWLPGTAGNFMSTPSIDVSAPNVVSVRALVVVDDVAPSTSYGFANQYQTGSNNRMWRFVLATDGALKLYVSDDGIANDVLIGPSFAVSGAAAGDIVEVGFDFDNTTGDCDFFIEGVNEGSDSTVLFPLHGGTAAVDIGCGYNSVSEPLSGRVYSVTVDGDGTPVLDVNLADATEPYATFTERANGATVTINRSASGYVSTVVDRGTRVFSTDDVVRVPDHPNLDFAITDDFTLLVASRTHDANYANIRILAGKMSSVSTVEGYMALMHSGSVLPVLRYQDGTAAIQTQHGTPITDGTLYVTAAVHDGTAQDATPFYDGVAGSATDLSSFTGTYENSTDFSIGGRTTGANSLEGEILAVALFREALTDEEIAAVSKILATATADAQDLHGDALFVWMHQNAYFDSRELVGALNELNGTRGVEYRKARKVFLSQDY